MTNPKPLNAADIARVTEHIGVGNLRVEVVLGQGNHYYVTGASVVTGGAKDGVLVLDILHSANYSPEERI